MQIIISVSAGEQEKDVKQSEHYFDKILLTNISLIAQPQVT